MRFWRNLSLPLRNLQVMYLLKQGKFDQALERAKQVRDLTRQHLGEGHLIFAISSNNLAEVYRQMGRYAEAEPLFRQALEIRREALGEDHPDVAESLNNLAQLYHHMGEYDAAELLYREALEIRREVLGEDHPDVAQSLNNLAALYGATNREAEALSLMTEAAAIQDRMIRQVFSIGSEDQRMAYLKRLRGGFAAFLSLTLEYFSRSPATVQATLDLLLRRKAIGAEAMAAQRDAVLGGRYPELQPKLRALTILRRQIAEKILAGPGPEGLQTHQQLLAKWDTRKTRLDADLVSRIPEMNLEPALRSADRQSVARALPGGAALVEFVRFDVYDFHAVPARGELQWKPARYLAFVVPAEMPDDVRMIDLGEAEPIDRLIASFRASVTGEAELDGEKNVEVPMVEPDTVSVQSDRRALRKTLVAATRHARPRSSFEGDVDAARLGFALREALFDPLLAALSGRKRLYVAPDGDLARLPFEALPDSDGGYLIDEYQISYLGVGRDVLRFGAESTERPSPSLVAADPDFDLGSADGLRISADEAPFGRLQGTRAEGERIAEQLDVEPLLGGRALETSVKGNRSPRVLHVATHGFFLPDAPREPNKERIALGSVESRGDGSLAARLGHAENPLLRSGLALAGANTWLEGASLPEEAEDGLLTAEDVTGMDLLATELVVLSACETGLGEVHVGEGVYGLRRAFVLAGAKTLVMSLWKVPDRQTQELMEDFYRRLLRGESRANALREAQLAIKERYPDPFHWGAFICQGDPRRLREYELPRVSSAGHND